MIFIEIFISSEKQTYLRVAKTPSPADPDRVRLQFPFPETGKIQEGEIQPFSVWDIRNATLESEVVLADNRAPEALLCLISLN